LLGITNSTYEFCSTCWWDGPVQSVFFRQPGRNGYSFYVVAPNGSGNNGYINPDTGRPWHLDHNNNNIPGFIYDQFPSNLASAMDDHAHEKGRLWRSWDNADFDVNSNRFYKEWQQYHHPCRIVNNSHNWSVVRKAFRRLP